MSNQAVTLNACELQDGAEGDVRRLATEAAVYAAAGMADNTRRAYRSDWADFATWCWAARMPSLPAASSTVALYLTARAADVSVSTLARRLAAIRTAHKTASFPAPEGGDLKRVWAGIRRMHGRPARKKRALVTQDLRRAINATPTTLIGLRDRAILLIGFAGALRRSELAVLELGAVGPNRIGFVAGGLEVHLDKSKGDQEGRGAVIGIPYGKTKLCPVAALQAWLDAAGIKSGPVFRPVNRWGSLGDGAVSAYAVALVVKAAAKRAGLDPKSFGGHSLRAGLITSAAAAGVATDVIMQQSRHVRYDTMRGYIRDGERFTRNAAAKVGL